MTAGRDQYAWGASTAFGRHSKRHRELFHSADFLVGVSIDDGAVLVITCHQAPGKQQYDYQQRHSCGTVQ